MIPPPLRINIVIPLCFLPLILFYLIINHLPLSLCLSRSSDQFNPIIMPGKRNLSTSSSLSSQPMAPFPSRNKKLRRLPHVFSKVLELPYDSDADVSVEDRPDCLRFIANDEEGVGGHVVLDGDVRAHVVEVHPGVTKVVIRRRESRSQLPLIDDLELNVWRFRLPAAARPELAIAVYARGQLVVTVPKNGWGENNNRGDHCKGGFRGNMENLVLVQ